MVTMPTYLGGLGFNYKWNMGWMNDMLRYMSLDPVYRKYHHNLVTFSFMYAFSENFTLPLSHDEVVHGKRSLLDKMPGDYWQKFANLRALLAYMMAHPGKKLLFMGLRVWAVHRMEFRAELGLAPAQLPHAPKIVGVQQGPQQVLLRKPLSLGTGPQLGGFQWIDANDSEQSVLTFLRRGKDPNDYLIIVANFTPILREPLPHRCARDHHIQGGL